MYDKKNLFSVGTIKNENISWEQLLSDIGKNNGMHMGIIHCTISQFIYELRKNSE